MLEKWLDVFGDLLDDFVPKAYLVYEKSRESYLNDDLVTANKLKRLNYLLHNSEVPYTAEIGKNPVFAYGGIGVIIHADAKIGQRCNFGSSVTVGGDRNGVPVIGNDVYLSTGAKVIGGVKIGDGAIIGANSVVLTNVEPFSVVAGAPSKLISEVNIDNFEKYSGFYWCKGDDEKIKRFKEWYFIKKKFRMP
ncbi:hypothetical protein BGL48_14035 [Salinivibrio sp. SS3]|uniref:serine acetyltransferase n=1 Tax=Salinivibrio sp. SS3 TaxID=1895021 RepID=UPI00084821C5|nr:serine acetyltransferase [Salinivibrio sp. BNH]ODP97418.1 hypothetical protein BGL48_14035 [Salinivibrio sp. BNH]